VQVSSNRKPAPSPLVSLGDALFDDEPIDGLDILSIEPHLIARTILDAEDEIGKIALSREQLAQMFADFDSISDDELDALCMA
jgi:hypothetical protein